MSLTLKYNPDGYSSFNDDLIYTVLSDKISDSVTYPNFKYIADVFVGGVLVARLKKIPNPTTGIGIFNIGQIVRNYQTTTFDPAAGLVSMAFGEGAFIAHVKVQFGEEYSFEDHLNITEAVTQSFFNSFNKRSEKGTGHPIQSKVDNFATNQPLACQVLLSSEFYFVPFVPLAGESYDVTITPILNNGTTGTPLVSTIDIGELNEMQVLNLAPQSINAVSAGTITSAHKGYTIKVGTDSDTLVFSIICEPIYLPVPIHFMNQYGGFETKLFTKVKRKNYDITKSDFGKLPYAVDSEGAVTFKNSNGVHNESRSVYASQFTEKMTLNSDWITDAAYIWLKDLIVSPMIFIEEDGEFYPCVITDNNYEEKKYINDDLTNLTIAIEFGNQLNAQFR